MLPFNRSSILLRTAVLECKFRNISNQVKVAQGIVRGVEESLPNGNNFFRFSGIPYAKAPIGSLRFRAPQRLQKFESHEIDCSKERDACFHKSTVSRKYIGSEDCLNLNIYVPQSSSSEKLAVMVYIHGGGLKYDSNSTQLYSPEYLLMENVIVVTINYRLHVLGFISYPSKGVSGNIGYKDQQLALEWIHENISAFNGDADNICLFGESSGGGSAHFHVLNKRSRRFIRSAICQSGQIFSDFNYQGQCEATAKRLAELCGLPCTSEDEEVFDALAKAPVKDLYDNCDRVLSQEDHNYGIRNKWRGVVESKSDESFADEQPVDLIVNQREKQIEIPMIFGTNSGDGMPSAASIVSRKKIDFVNENFHFMIPRSIHRVISEAERDELAEKIRDFYLEGQKLTMENMLDFVYLRTDVDYFIPQTICNDLHLRFTPKCPQYLYEFQFDGRLNLQKKQMRMSHLPVAGHADDIFHIFGGELVSQVELEVNSREDQMRRTMCKLWANFAKYQNPTPDHDNPLSFKWSPIENLNSDYLVLNDECKLVRGLNKERRDFWLEIYKKYHSAYSESFN